MASWPVISARIGLMTISASIMARDHKLDSCPKKQTLVFTYFPHSGAIHNNYTSQSGHICLLHFSVLLYSSVIFLWSSVVFCCFLHLHELNLLCTYISPSILPEVFEKFGSVDTTMFIKILHITFIQVSFKPAPSRVQSRQCSSSQNTRSDQSTPWIQSDVPLRELR